MVVNPSGPHHRDRCRTSVNASNTSSRGASMTREITISRSAVADCAGASRPMSLPSVTPPALPASRSCTYASSRSKLSFQNRSNPPVHSWTGRSPRASRPYRRCLPALRSRTSPTSRSTRRCLDAPGWVIPSSWANSVTGRSPARSSDQDLPALRLGDRVEDVRRRRCSCHRPIIFRYRYASVAGRDFLGMAAR